MTLENTKALLRNVETQSRWNSFHENSADMIDGVLM